VCLQKVDNIYPEKKKQEDPGRLKMDGSLANLPHTQHIHTSLFNTQLEQPILSRPKIFIKPVESYRRTANVFCVGKNEQKEWMSR
jgi:hypothetical protein